MAPLATGPRITKFCHSIQLCVLELAKETLWDSFLLEVIRLHRASKEGKVSKHCHILPPPEFPDKAWYGKSTGQGVRRLFGMVSMD